MPVRRYGPAYPTAEIGCSRTLNAAETIPFGVLVTDSATANKVVTCDNSGSPQPIGIAKTNAVFEVNNAAEQYVSGDPVAIQSLVQGQVYWVKTAGNIAKNSYLTATTSGLVRNPAATTTKTVYSLFQAIEAGSGAVNSGWFRAMKL